MTKKILTAEERRERNRQEMSASILSLAREMMRADGVAALSLSKIARRLGVTTPALYTYFDSKHAIYDALFRLGFEEFGEIMRRQVAAGGPPYEQVHGTIEAYLAFAQENPELYELMLHRPVPGFVPSEESMAVSLRNLQEGSDWIRQLLEEAQMKPPMPVEEARDLLFSIMEGLTSLHMANDPELPVGQGRFGKLTAHAARLFFDAWGADDE